MPTKKEVDQISSAAMAEMIAEAVKSGAILEPGKTIADVSSISVGNFSEPEAEDMVTIYSTKDGLPSTIPIYMLQKHLTRRWTQDHTRNGVPQSLVGKPVWSTTPVVKSVQPTQLCILHPDHPDRAHTDSLGLAGAYCNKANLKNDYEVEQHLRHKHSRESLTYFTALEREQARAAADNTATLLARLVDGQESKRGG